MDKTEDNIYDLPANGKYNVHPDDLKIISNVFGEDVEKHEAHGIVHELKIILVMCILFFVLSLKIVDDIVLKLSPLCENYYTRLLVKTLIFGVLYYLLHNQLSK
jgi:hypothetical protein